MSSPLEKADLLSREKFISLVERLSKLIFFHEKYHLIFTF